MGRPPLVRPTIYLRGTEHLSSMRSKTETALEKAGKLAELQEYSLLAGYLFADFERQLRELTMKYVDIKE